ncbi:MULTISPECIES: hypothetical protein [unclassified Pseudomonas]|uniref:hypothetical protein n=1 Tax=unclassified Pseudomonas TaxID=196821 RepID=UPI0011799E84|nr:MULTISPECIES: hypothetical protein [unclassified Pseudomonas]
MSSTNALNDNICLVVCQFSSSQSAGAPQISRQVLHSRPLSRAINLVYLTLSVITGAWIDLMRDHDVPYHDVLLAN